MADEPFPPTRVKDGPDLTPPTHAPAGPPPPTARAGGSVTPLNTPDPDRTTDHGRPADGGGDSPSAAVPGYQVFEQLGQGGMGVVYRARDPKLGRVVALKMVAGHARPDDKAVIRFLAEAQAAAAVRHPNVVQVFDYGDHAGRPYMALEFCPGGTLTARLQPDGPDGPRVRLDPHAAADLVAKIAAGVGAAHAEGIVHRDLKPGNVLFDAAGEPKVADFGLAKRGLGTDLTRTGALLGTPQYMSPEQVGGGAKFVGPAADVWALGVILYECLAGDRPFTAETLDGVYHRIVSGDPVGVRRAAPGVPRDLALVCGKCLEKEPHRRYPTARELADDLGRFLGGRTVKAQPVGPLGTARRWAKRNPTAAVLIGAVVALAGVLGGVLVQQYRQAIDRADLAERSERLARENATAAAELLAQREAAGEQRARADRLAGGAAVADRLAGFMTGLFATSSPLDIFGKDIVPPNYGERQAKTARDFLAEAETALTAGLDDQPLVRAKLLLTIGNSYRDLGEFKKADPLLRRALADRRADLPADHPDVLEAEFRVAQLSLDTGDFFDAADRFRRVLDAQARAGADPKVRSLTRGFLGFALGAMQKPEAADLLKDEIAVRKELYGPTHRETLFPQIGLVAHLFDTGRWDEALPYTGAIAAGIKAQPDDGFRAAADAVFALQAGVGLRFTAARMTGVAKSLTLGQSETATRAALDKLKAALPPVHIYAALGRFELATVLRSRGDLAAAEVEYKATWDLVRQTCGPAHPKVITLLDDHSSLLLEVGRPDEARALFDEVEKANLAQFGADNYWRATLVAARGQFEASAGDLDRAAAAAAEVVALAGKGRLMRTRPAAARAHNLAQELHRKGRPGPAADLFAAALPAVRESCGDPSPEVCTVLTHYGQAVYDRGDRAAGADLVGQAAAMSDRVGGLRRDVRTDLLVARATLDRDAGRPADAEPHARQAAKQARADHPPASAYRRKVTLLLAGVLADQGKYAEAADLADEAARGLTADALPLRRVVMLRAADGDAAGAAAALRKLTDKHGRSADPAVLAEVVRAWAYAPPGVTGWGHAAGADRLAGLLADQPKAAGLHRALALARLRAGDPAGARAAVARFGGPAGPLDHLLLGLAAAHANDPDAARASLAKADELLAADRPTTADPFALARWKWWDRLAVETLRGELARALDPHLAPPPRPSMR